MKDERKDLFRFVNGFDELNNKNSFVKSVDKIDEWDGKSPFVFGEGLEAPKDCAEED